LAGSQYSGFGAGYAAVRLKDFDRDKGRVSIWGMKAVIALMFLSLAALGAQEQQQQSKGSGSRGDRLDSPVNERLMKEVLKEIEASHASAKVSANVGRHLRFPGSQVLSAEIPFSIAALPFPLAASGSGHRG